MEVKLKNFRWCITIDNRVLGEFFTKDDADKFLDLDRVLYELLASQKGAKMQ